MVPTRPLTLPRVLCIVGPTASGKTRLAIELAREFDGEIVNADSRQFYRELNIGTAKPSKEELTLVPHHLVNCTSLIDTWDAGHFVKNAHAAIVEITSRGKLPIIVGGTGMYIRHLLFGLAEIPAIPASLRRSLEDRLQTEGLAALYHELEERDPSSARQLEPHDTLRILRRLEVVLHTGRSMHAFWPSEKTPLFTYTKLGLNRDRLGLYEKIDARVRDMIHHGLKREAEELFQRFPKNPVLCKTIGYAEWDRLGFDQDEDVVREICKNSRRFAKRQLTWFRHENDIQWLDCENGSRLREEAQKIITDSIITNVP